MYLVTHNISYLLFQTSHPGHVYIYGAEYQTESISPISHANDHNVASALCTTYGYTTKTTIHLIMSAIQLDGRENLTVTSWLDIMVTMLLPSSLV